MGSDELGAEEEGMLHGRSTENRKGTLFIVNRYHLHIWAGLLFLLNL